MGKLEGNIECKMRFNVISDSTATNPSLQLAYPAGSVFDDLLNMLDEMSLSLPRFRSYEETLPMNEALESVLVDVYTEMICFCARTINFFRKNPHRRFIPLPLFVLYRS